jgi:uncharacterized protein (DUF58 family)
LTTVKPETLLPKGATSDVAALIGTRFSARYLDVTKASRALAHLAGAKRSRRRGRGVEFDEVRQYTAGDDVRSIDWRVTARSGSPHTKLFHEERERPVLVAVDLRRSMQFGSRNCFKSVLAAHTASLLLWSALDRGERVGGMVVRGSQVSDFRPARSRHTVLSLIGEMTTSHRAGEQEDETPMAEQLRQLRRIARPGSALFIISDFHDGLEESALEPLRQLAKHVQITAIAVHDSLEQELPLAGRYVVADDLGRSALNTQNSSLRSHYRTGFEQQIADLASALLGLRIPLIRMRTDEPPLPTLQRYFPARQTGR